MNTEEKYPLALPVGTVLAGQYVIEQVLGQGGFGITYRAEDHKSGQKVAVKEFFPDTMATRTKTMVTAFAGERGESFAYGKGCFLQEAETLAEFIGNENIVRVHSYFEENGTAYFVMDFVEGISFDAYIKEHGGRIGWEEAERILLPVIDALAAVHSRGIIHRDVTPDNIYITKDGTVKLLDFGAARYSLGDKSRSLDVVLKHGFAPKEQYTRHGKQGPYTDVYTVGASLYFAVTGRRPPDSIDRLEEDDLIPPSSLGVSVSPAKEEALLRAMSVQPAERFQTMGELKQALLGAGTGPVTNRGGMTGGQEQPVQQRFFTAPEQSVQGQASPLTSYIPNQTPPVTSYTPSQTPPVTASAPVTEEQKKKKWILPVGIGAGATLLLIIIIIVAVSVGSRDKKAKDKSVVHYDTLDESDTNLTTEDTDPLTEPESTAPEESDGSDIDTPESTQDTGDDMLPENPAFVSTGVEILGNTPANLMNYGQLVATGNDMFLAYPGGHGLISSQNGEVSILDEDGYVRCISVVGDKIYYINTGLAYQINKDGTGKEQIPELVNYESIASLYVSEEYYYIYQNGDKLLSCISRGTGDTAGRLTCKFDDWFTFVNGYVYYLREVSSERELWRVPANDLSSLGECMLGADKVRTGWEIVAEGDYLYCLSDNAADGDKVIFQYDVNSGQIAGTYTFTGWQGRFGSLNVCDQYIYYGFEYAPEDDNDDYRERSVYRFYAEPGEGSFDTELVYKCEEGQSLSYLTTLQEAQGVVLTVWGDKDALILTSMDGSGEPSVMENQLD